MKRNTAVSAKEVKDLKYDTPFFLFAPQKVENAYDEFKKFFPLNTRIFYSMKSNAEPSLLKILGDQNCGFEVSTSYELELLKVLNVHPSRIIIGNSVKSIDEIKKFKEFGINVFAFDSEQELHKLAKYAPGSKVYVRALVDDKADSVFTMSEKFGVPINEVARLSIMAKQLGLIPYGVSFNVGSQARNPKAWANGVKSLLDVISQLKVKGIEFEMINLGGGFPWKYYEEVDTSLNTETIAKYVKSALEELPYPISNVYIEPGRALSANAYALVSTVIANIPRANGKWLHIDSGSYNPLLEAMPFQGAIQYEITPVEQRTELREDYILTGPTCDSLDIVRKQVALPSDMQIGDRVIVQDVGAYSFTLSTPFNGFPLPKTYIL